MFNFVYLLSGCYIYVGKDVSVRGYFRSQKGSASKNFWEAIGRFTYSMPFPCRAHAVPPPCRAAKGLECVFPIWFTQCGRVWFTLAMPCSDHAVLLKVTAQHGRLATAVLCCGLEKNGMVGAWHGHSMASVNQTRSHCVNQMVKAHSKPLAARHGRGTACYVWIGL